MRLLERIKRCHYCGSEMKVSSDSYSQNPFCDGCYDERLKKATAAAGPGHMEWIEGTRYLQWVKDSPTE